MKTTILARVMFGCLSATAGLAQTNGPLAIEWQQSFGGSGEEMVFSAHQTADGGFILAGASASGANGNKTSPLYGASDSWVVRLDAAGQKRWDVSCGGSNAEGNVYVREVPGGGFLLAGLSLSPVSGSKTSSNFGTPNSAEGGYCDVWIVRLDDQGIQLWDKSVGSSMFDMNNGLIVDPRDGSFTIGGHSRGSISGTKTSANWGYYDLWLAHFDAEGNPLWDRSFGGTDAEMSGTCAFSQCIQGRFMVGGCSWSIPSGNKTSPKYSTAGYNADTASDFWVVLTDSDGNKLWDATFGSRGGNSRLDDIVSLPDGGFLLVGWSTATPASGVDGNKTSPVLGGKDGWIVRIDAAGTLLWDRSLGGEGDDLLSAACALPDGGFLLAGESNSSPGGNKTSPNLGGNDLWLVRVDALGNKLWDQTLGGTAAEGRGSQLSPTRLLPVSGGGFLLAGNSASPVSGNKTTPAYGNLDYWVLKLAAEPDSPTLVDHPVPHAAPIGGTATFRASAYCAHPFAFQWQHNGEDLLGATNAILTLSEVQPEDAGHYAVVVSNAFGSMTSRNAILSVVPLLITSPPQDVTVPPGQQVALTVTVEGAEPVTYQWRHDGIEILGATNASLILPDVQLADEGQYDVVVTNPLGSVTSLPVSLSLFMKPVILVPPMSQTVVEHGDLTLSATILGGPPPFLFQWRRGTTVLANMIMSERTCFFTLTNVLSSQGGLYRVCITNAASPFVTAVYTNFTITVLSDGDADGLPDEWELATGLCQTHANHADGDCDGDGQLNCQEYLAGTDPMDPASCLQVDQIALNDAGAGIALRFFAVSNKTYSIQYQDNAGQGEWTSLTHIVAAATNRTVEVFDPWVAPDGTCRFYRLVTPCVP